MTTLNRRGWIGRCLGSLLVWGGLRPAAPAAAAPAACRGPVHNPACAALPDGEVWYRVRLLVACPHCGASIEHPAYLPGPSVTIPPARGTPGPDADAASFGTESYSSSWRGDDVDPGEGRG
jgi:hypothetical protein